MRIGVVGCGNISDVYLSSPSKFGGITIAAVADLDRDRAKAKAEKHGVSRVLDVDALIADPDIDIVLNLTIPQAHFSVCMAGIEAGKHVYVEKPLSLTRDEGDRLMAAADAKGVRVGGAPDTFLGAGIQTCRKLIDDGVIGRPVAAAGFMLGHGHESWHPSPEFYYQAGGGPLLDMGPYYLTAMIALMGPIKAVTGMARVSFPEREITSEPKRGQKIVVETPTHIAGVMEMVSGAIATLTTSFDVWHAQVPRIEIYGSEGTLSVPDPNGFGGPVRMRLRGEADWQEIPLTHGHADNCRGIGIAEMADAIRQSRPHRASGDLANHVLEAMHGILQSSDDRRHYELKTHPSQPEALPTDWKVQV